MARHKTKTEKIKSAKRRSEEANRLSVVYSLDESHLRQTGKIRSVNSKLSRASFTGNLFGYDPTLLRGDLVKTILISGLMFSVLALIYFYLGN